MAARRDCGVRRPARRHRHEEAGRRLQRLSGLRGRAVEQGLPRRISASRKRGGRRGQAGVGPGAVGLQAHSQNDAECQRRGRRRISRRPAPWGEGVFGEDTAPSSSEAPLALAASHRDPPKTQVGRSSEQQLIESSGTCSSTKGGIWCQCLSVIQHHFAPAPQHHIFARTQSSNADAGGTFYIALRTELNRSASIVWRSMGASWLFTMSGIRRPQSGLVAAASCCVPYFRQHPPPPAAWVGRRSSICNLMTVARCVDASTKADARRSSQMRSLTAEGGNMDIVLLRARSAILSHPPVIGCPVESTLQAAVCSRLPRCWFLDVIKDGAPPARPGGADATDHPGKHP